MKARFPLTIALVIVLALTTTAVEAQWDALNSGYALTTNYHGVDVPVGTNVIARAGTTEYPEVTSVRFRWIPPTGDEILTDKIPLQDSGEYFDGKLIYDTYDTMTIDVVGNWSVQAWFYDDDGNLRHETGIEKIRATSFLVIPEAPFGTLAIIFSMLGGLSLFALKRKMSLRTR